MVSSLEATQLFIRASASGLVYKAWASCHHLALIEVWRGLRDDYTWALKSHFVWKKSKRILGGCWGSFSKGLGIVSTFFGMSLFFFFSFFGRQFGRNLTFGMGSVFFKTFFGKGNGKGSYGGGCIYLCQIRLNLVFSFCCE